MGRVVGGGNKMQNGRIGGTTVKQNACRMVNGGKIARW